MWGEESALTVTYWDSTDSEADMNYRVDSFLHAAEYGGSLIRCDEGCIWVKPGSPFVQAWSEVEPGVKARIFNFQIESLTKVY